MTYETVPYVGRRRVATIPKMVLRMAPAIAAPTAVQVPVRQLVTGIDREYRAHLEKDHALALTMVDDASGYVTNTLVYRGGLAALTHVF